MKNDKVYDEDVRTFVNAQKGVFLVLSHDQLFGKNLRNTIVRHLALKEECIISVYTLEQLHSGIGQQLGQGNRVLIFIEREINGKNCHDLVQLIKIEHPEVMVVVLTSEVAREMLIYLHELGANNVITKPFSADTLIEKIAFTVKPRGQIGELIEAGKALNASGKHDEAVAMAHRILEIKPKSPAALILLGDSFKGLGDTQKALDAYNNAYKNAKLYLEPIRKIAELHKENGNIREETKYLEKLDRLSPLNVERKVTIGGNYMALGEPDKASEIFNDAMKLATKEAQAQMSRVSRAIADQCLLSNPELSEKYLRLSLEVKKGGLDKSDIDTFNRLGITLRKQGRWSDAVVEYRRALKISPEDAGLYYNTAMAFTEGKEAQKALKHLDKALELDPELWAGNETICLNIAMAYYNCADKERALEFAKRALEVNSSSEKARILIKKIGERGA
ncbi:MAG: tetratricopeptide repeat protein [Desulfovibrio sp.]|nr:tetratricopeptide repeat protein [Desulfovibrio sp.]